MAAADVIPLEPERDRVQCANHNWPIIIDYSRETLQAIRNSEFAKGIDTSKFYGDGLTTEARGIIAIKSAASRAIVGPVSGVANLFTCDVRTDAGFHVPEDETPTLLWLVYQDRPALQAAATRLWWSYASVLLPRTRALVPLPQFSDDELTEFEGAIDGLEAAVALFATDAIPPRPLAGDDRGAAKRPKRSTKSGEAQKKIKSALLAHHKYDNGSVGNYEAIGTNALARLAHVSADSVNRFFTSEFEGDVNYQRQCANGQIVDALKILDEGVKPSILSASLRDK